MLNIKSFLTVDFGAGSLKLAEFEINEAGGLCLKNFSIKPLGLEGSQEASREKAILQALQEVIAEKGIKSKFVNVCAPGFHVFSKFVKLPPVDANKVGQIIQYEAQQNVPFPLSEVVWDYQILGSAPGGELEVLLVAIKSEIVEGLFRVADQAKLKLQLCDASMAALCNAFKFNYGELEDCTMLLDIGAKTSNLLFFEKGKVFSRSINLGANSITQDFANESKKKFDAAEKVKISEGFVSLGGAYEEPENQDQAAISKIARQFMTRLHIQVNQTMQFYRGQQGGSAPARLFLSGGASIMPYTAQFFAEKLNVPVEYFNPLRNIQIDPSINLEDLARVAHSMGEVVGLGLRNLAQCPVELNLMPESTLKWQSFNQKKPYLVAAVFSMVAVVAAIGLLFDKLAGAKADALEKLHREVEPLKQKSQQFETARANLQKTQKDADQIVTWMDERYYWADVLSELRRIMIKVEGQMKIKLHTTDTGVWVEQFVTGEPRTDVDLAAAQAQGQPAAPDVGEAARRAAADELFRKRYGLTRATMRQETPTEQTVTVDATGTAARKKKAGPNEVASITVTFRAISLSGFSPEANKEVVYSMLNEIKSSPLFDPDWTDPDGKGVGAEEPPGTFTFGITVGLKRPFKL